MEFNKITICMENLLYVGVILKLIKISNYKIGFFQKKQLIRFFDCVNFILLLYTDCCYKNKLNKLKIIWIEWSTVFGVNLFNLKKVKVEYILN